MNTEKTAAAGAKAGPVGIIGALEQELRLLKTAMDVERTETVTGMDFYLGRLNGTDAVLVQCGMGKVNAAVCAQTLILRYGVRCVVNTGVAGSLFDDVPLRSIVVSSDAIQHDMDLTPLGGKKGEIVGSGLMAFRADAELRRRAVAAASAVAPETQVREGRVCSGDQFIADSASRHRIVGDFGGLCCEMEGAAIGQVCTLNGVPFVIIRSISDAADNVSPEAFWRFLEDSGRSSAAIVCAMFGADGEK